MERLPGIPRLAMVAVTGAAMAAIVAGVLLMQERLGRAAAEIDRGDPLFVTMAGLCFASGLTASGLAWRAGLGLAGTPVSRTDAVSRYVVGSLANSILPLRAGGVLRLALYQRKAHDVRTVAGVATAIGSLRCLSLALLVSLTALLEPLPVWPAAVMTAAALGGAALSLVAGRSSPFRRDVVCPALAGTVARVAAAACLCAAYGVPAPLAAGMAVVVALEVAGTLPVTPGNLGVSTAAITFALVAHGLSAKEALTVAIVLPVLETAASITLGVSGVVCLVQLDRLRLRRRAVVVAPPAPAASQ